MLHASQLKSMPPNHEFAKGDGFYPELHPTDRIRWIAVWDGSSWRIRVAPVTKNFKEVATTGRIVDIPKIIHQIVPCTEDAFNLYFK